MENPVMLLLIGGVFGLLLAVNWVRVLKEDERAVISRLGKVHAVRGPGLVLVLNPIEKMVKVGLQPKSYEIPSLDITTVDQVKLKANGLVHYRISDAAAVVRKCDDYDAAMAEISTVAMREVLPTRRVYDLLYNRPEIDEEIKHNLENRTLPLGIEITEMKILAIDIPPDMASPVARLIEDEEIRLKQMKMKR